MILNRRVALGGTQLDSLDSRIVIRSIDTGIPHESISAENRMSGWGQRVTGQHWETLEVAVTWAMDIPKKQLATRQAVYEKVCKWALNRGWLTVNYLSGRRMYVDKVVLPSAGDLWQWTSEFTIIFRAYNVPFWQEATPTTGSGDSGTVLLEGCGGNYQAPLDFTFENTGEADIDSLTVSAGGRTVTFASLGLAPEAVLSFEHGTDGLLRIMIGDESAYGKYSGDDDLIIEPGDNYVTFESDGTGELTVSHYGRFI